MLPQSPSRMLCLLLAITTVYAFQIEPNACNNPLIIQYLRNYTIPVDDLQTLVSTNISSLTINSVSNKNVSFSQVKCTLTYTDGKSVSRQNPLQVVVVGDSFAVHMVWTANVSKTLGHNSYNITADVAAIKVDYIKLYNTVNNTFSIANVTYKFTSDMIVVKTINPSPSDAQRTKIQSTVKNQLFTAFNQQLKSLPQWLEDSAKKQKVAETYTNDTYNYDYYGWTLPIDTKTLVLTPDGANNFINGYRGNIIGQTNQFCPDKTPQSQQKYNMYLSMEFIQNFAKAVVERYTPYKSVQLNSTWVRTDTFQFRLVDLEYVLAGAFQKYGQYYMNSVTFNCGAQELMSGFITNHELTEIVKWKCDGLLWTTNTTSVPIIDAQITMSHKMWITVHSGSLATYSNENKIVETKFNAVGDITVKNIALAKAYISQFLNDLRTYTPGTFFKVTLNGQKLDIVDDANIGAGIWIG